MLFLFFTFVIVIICVGMLVHMRNSCDHDWETFNRGYTYEGKRITSRYLDKKCTMCNKIKRETVL